MSDKKEHWVLTFKLEWRIPKPKRMQRFAKKNIHWILLAFYILLFSITSLDEMGGYFMGVLASLFGALMWHITKPNKRDGEP